MSFVRKVGVRKSFGKKVLDETMWPHNSTKTIHTFIHKGVNNFSTRFNLEQILRGKIIRDLNLFQIWLQESALRSVIVIQ